MMYYKKFIFFIQHFILLQLFLNVVTWVFIKVKHMNFINMIGFFTYKHHNNNYIVFVVSLYTWALMI